MLSLERLKGILRELDAKSLVISLDKLFCSVCKCEVSRSKKQKIEQHLETQKHRSNLNKIYVQSLLITNTSFTTQRTFNSEISTCFIRTNIPLQKLLDPNLKAFFHKYTQYTLPDPSTLRKNYITPQYHEILQKIRLIIGNKKIWICIDTSKDLLNRDIAIVVIGVLDDNLIKASYVLNLDVLEHSNSDTIARLFSDSLQILYPEGIQYDNVLLYLSDGAHYMKKSFKLLENLYNKMVHVTCVAHMLHLVAEEARKFSKLANDFTNYLKKVFKKSPSNVSIFKQLYPELPLPPETVVTRWGTWVTAISYTVQHFEALKDILGNIDADSSYAAYECKRLLEDERLHQELLAIHDALHDLPGYIDSLESNDNVLKDYILIIKKFKTGLERQETELGTQLLNKLISVLNKNKGLMELYKLQRYIDGERIAVKDIILTNSVFFRVSKCTSVEVERRFSQFKDFLSDKKLAMKEQFIKEMFVIMGNKHL